MGSYDRVYVPCPKCCVINELQSKGGSCEFKCYSLQNAPVDVLSDVNRHGNTTCKKCGAIFTVHVVCMAQAVLVAEIPDDDCG